MFNSYVQLPKGSGRKNYGTFVGNLLFFPTRASCLVSGFNPSEKILVNWDDYSQSIKKKCHVPKRQPVAVFPFFFVIPEFHEGKSCLVGGFNQPL